MFDSETEDAFVLKFGKKNMSFIGDEKGLYLLDKDKRGQCHAIRIEGFSKQEVDRSRKTRKLYHQLAEPPIMAFKSLLRQNIIRNCEVK